jgi:hypothetical protein
MPFPEYSGTVRGKEPFMDTVKNVENRTDIGIGGECPLDHTPNAETIAALEEGNAILKGEIPSAVFIDPRQYQTRDELKTALKEALQG